MSALIAVSPVTVVDPDPAGCVEALAVGLTDALAVGLADGLAEGLVVPVGTAELPGAWLADGFEVELLVSPPDVFPPSSISYV